MFCFLRQAEEEKEPPKASEHAREGGMWRTRRCSEVSKAAGTHTRFATCSLTVSLKLWEKQTYSKTVRNEWWGNKLEIIGVSFSKWLRKKEQERNVSHLKEWQNQGQIYLIGSLGPIPKGRRVPSNGEESYKTEKRKKMKKRILWKRLYKIEKAVGNLILRTKRN